MEGMRGKKEADERPKILVFVAHSDDQALGPGGAIAAYSKQGYAVHTIVCSFGEMSHPHLKPEVIRKTRVQEAKRADTILGGVGVSFLGLKEGRFMHNIRCDDERLMKNLIIRLKEGRPAMVFTHGPKDNHPDHRAASRIIAEAIRRARIKAELYTFSLYKVIHPKHGPRLLIDITDVFNKKLDALHVFKSQISVLTHAQTNNLVYLAVYVRAFLSGLRFICWNINTLRKSGFQFAESYDLTEPEAIK